MTKLVLACLANLIASVFAFSITRALCMAGSKVFKINVVGLCYKFNYSSIILVFY